MSAHPPCQDVDPEIFWPISFGSLASARQVEQACAVCARCPIKKRCLRDALANPHAGDGIWAGTTPAERDELRQDEAVASRG